MILRHPPPSFLLSLLLGCVLFTGLAADAVAGSADIEGTLRYQINGDRITIEIERIANNTSSVTTGTLYVTVQMTPGRSVLGTGYRVARHRITGSSNGQLRPGRYFNIRETLDYSAPPAGTYYVHFYTSQYPDRDTVLDSYTFQRTITIGRRDDHGSTRGQATNVHLNTTTRGALERPGDVDYFRVTVTTAGTLTVETNSTIDTVGYLQGDEGQYLAGNDDAGDDDNFRIVRNVGRGTYYVAVTGYQRRATGAYTLHVGFTANGGSGSAQDDHGNARTQATRVSTSSTTRGHLERQGDVDYFRVEVPANGQLRVATSGRTDTFGYVGTAARWLTQDDDAGTDDNFRIVRNVGRGTYYVAVTGYQRRATGAYTLHVGFTAGGGDDHGNTRTQATRVSTPSTTRGHLERQGDVDYFRVEVPANGQLRVRTSGRTDTFGYVGTAARWLAQDDDAGTDGNFRIVRNVGRGTYYVAVTGYQRRATGAYTLHVGFTANDDHGNTLGQATRISPNSTTPGAIERAGDVDYFRVAVTQAGTLTVETTGRTDTFGYLRAANGATLGQDDDGGGANLNFRIAQAVQAGTYYVAVVGYDRTATTGPYILRVRFSP